MLIFKEPLYKPVIERQALLILLHSIELFYMLQTFLHFYRESL